MLTKNFYNWLLSTGCATTLFNSITDVNGTVYNVSAAGTAERYCKFGEGLRNMGTTQSGGCAMIGAGRTEASTLDYKLESPITSGISVTNPTDLVRTNGDAAQTAVAALFVIENTRETDITVGEIGLFANVYVNANTTVVALVERTVLDEPVTIPAGESRQILYVIRLNYSA